MSASNFDYVNYYEKYGLNIFVGEVKGASGKSGGTLGASSGGGYKLTTGNEGAGAPLPDYFYIDAFNGDGSQYDAGAKSKDRSQIKFQAFEHGAHGGATGSTPSPNFPIFYTK